MIYTVTLNPALDYVLRLDELDSKDINRAKTAIMLYGGKGINVSSVLSRLGAETKALGFTAGFTGDALEKMLEADGIKSDFVKLEDGLTRINVKIFADKQTDINAPGPKISEENICELYNKIDKLVEGDILVLAGSVPKGIDSGIYESIMKRLEGKNIKIAVDTTGDELLAVLKYHPFLIKPNHHELSEIFSQDIKADDEEKIIKYAKELQKMGAVNVLVSRGSHGATLVDETGAVNSTSIKKGKTVNNVGCGDSMVAGFIAGFVKEKNYISALKLGSAAGNASAFCEGLASKEEIMNLKNNFYN